MKVKCTHSGIQDGSSSIVEGGIYDALYDGEYTYLLDDEGDRLYFNLKTGRCSWINKGMSSKWFSFEEVKEPKYATSPEVLAQVFRKMADNVERDIDAHSGIQFYCSINKRWIDKGGPDTYKNMLYRIKPETITLKNGVTIPKPLDVSEIEDDGHYYHVANYKMLAYEDHGASIKKDGVLFVYKTREEAIDASKALFGLEIKDV